MMDTRMRERIDGHDWSGSPLGAIDAWPASLRLAVDLMLDCGHAVRIAWGSAGTLLYNDAYAELLGPRHPAALGQPIGETWRDQWDAVAPAQARALAGETIRFDGLPLTLMRDGQPADTWWNASISPLRDDQGQITGTLNVAMEATSAERADRAEGALREEFRNTEILRELSARLVTEDNIRTIYEEILTAAIAMTGACAGTVQMIDPGSDHLVVLATRGFSERTQQHFARVDASSETSCGLALRCGKRSYQDFDPASNELPARLHVDDGVLSAQSTPLVSRSGKPIGMVSTHWPDSGHRLSECQLRFLDLLGRQAADLLEQRAVKEALRCSESRQAFLLGLSDRLRPLVDPADIMETAAALLGRHLGMGRVGYGEVDESGRFFRVERDWTDGLMASAVGVYRMSDYGEQSSATFMSGELVALEDAQASAPDAAVRERISASGDTRGSLVLPLVKDGRVVAGMYAAQSTPRSWSDEDKRLVVEVAERTWSAVERARSESALRESERKYRTLFDTMGEGFTVCRVVRDAAGTPVDLVYLELNGSHERQTGLKREGCLGRRFSEVFSPEDCARWMQVYAKVVDNGEAVTVEEYAEVTGRWYSVSAYRSAADEISIFYRDTTEAKRRERAFQESERLSRALIEGIPQMIWRAVDGGSWTWASPQWSQFTGQPEKESHGWGWLDALHPDDRGVARDAWSHALETGGFKVEYRIRGAGNGGYRWFQTRATPVHSDGRIIEWLGTSTDVDDLQRLQERQQLLVGELQHRTRNLLAVIRSMMTQLGAASSDLAQFRARFEDRLDALARVQGLLSRLGDADRITFDELIATEVAAMQGAPEKVTTDGPAGIRLRSSTVQTLAMALHELATNAAKYGALSQPDGRLEIRWRLGPADEQGRPRLYVDWRERGVRMPVAAATAAGSGEGRRLIENALPYQLGAETSFQLENDGVHCTLAIPVSQSNSAA